MTLIATLPGTGVFVGPGKVTRVDAGRLYVARHDDDGNLIEHRVQLALGYPYTPLRGDVLLLLGDPQAQLYVVGVIEGKGATRLDVPGDLELKAGGRVKITGHDSVDVKASRVTLRADRLETFARVCVERLGDACRFVRNLFTLRAGRSRASIDGHATLHAERIVEKARKDVRIDGERINLG